MPLSPVEGVDRHEIVILRHRADLPVLLDQPQRLLRRAVAARGGEQRVHAPLEVLRERTRMSEEEVSRVTLENLGKVGLLGMHLAPYSHAAGVFAWLDLHRQVRLRGRIERVKRCVGRRRPPTARATGSVTSAT